MSEPSSNNVNSYGICPFSTTQRVLNGKWVLIILYHISTGSKRFNQLQRLIPDISQSVLSNHLKQLEKDKLVERTVYAEVPPRVEYGLTEIGESFRKVLDEVETWGASYLALLEREQQ
ncbi:winged helix-turn-helix transcriptional regulator [Streptococcus cuniculi]|uniref:Transcriptional regulator n=1 Tax=Streptococcus cuniculi TaxID=1432788 RepID=A0A4Y9JA80_9STRE|nr:helix-turn-helix domain-containing protein [Streptococcus cuniculi]MBF0779296.1 helix-turn-helix transcriptional regulator [Streptococcus cuniculi]TFU96715.1 transcriptional regulator [Streptococcus cuniculi]